MSAAPCWASYRAPCRPFATGCRQCGVLIPPRRAYCSDECSEAFGIEHFWSTAQAEALRRAQPYGPAIKGERQPWIGAPVCSRCGKACGALVEARPYTIRREAEVHHVVPLNGKRPSFGCMHHQSNLSVYCHRCHVEIGKELRAQRKVA